MARPQRARRGIKYRIRLDLRAHQIDILEDLPRWACVVMHRRAGKSFYCVADLVKHALEDDSGDGRYFYIGPSYRQAKGIAWDLLLQFTNDIPRIINVQELSCEFENGARIKLLGAERADSLRGFYADRIICDEAQLMPSAIWQYVLRPMLADRLGSALIAGTPAGRYNLLGWAHEQLEEHGWKQIMLRHDQTDALAPGEVEDMRRQMSPQAWAQEMECSFEGSLEGAYYATQLQQAEADGRIGRYDRDPKHPVFAALDLGFSDALAIWYCQRVGNSLQLFRYEEWQGMSLEELVAHWGTLEFQIGQVILPHDAKVHDLGTGQARIQLLQGLGVNCFALGALPIHDGIEAVRMALPRCYFDQEGTRHGLEALRSYRSLWDEKRQVAVSKPIHDWASHGADAMRYLCLGEPSVTAGGWAPMPEKLRRETARRAI